MKKVFVIVLIFLLSIPFIKAQSSADEMEKLNAAFETYGAVFKLLVKDYVVPIDPEILMKKGIEGMLNSLDPYTKFIEDTESQDIDLLMQGNYTGLGITVETIDSMITVVSINDNSKVRNQGLRIGDKIYKIDSLIMINESNQTLRTFTSKPAGTNLVVEVIREGYTEPIQLTLTINEIAVNTLIFSTMLDDSTVYVVINSFSTSTGNELKQALLDFNNKYQLKNLIIDLRNNPGGLLASAVDVCELFLPLNTPIVKTMSKNTTQNFTYYTLFPPLDTNIRIAVLINENSASAAEIVAGAFQDLDRAVVIGSKSFGKGLVQSVRELPGNNAIKFTSSKYYIPSGRCIQKFDYKLAKEFRGLDLHRDSIFYSVNNRPLIESEGIHPDILIEEEFLNNYQQELLESYLIFKFVNAYTANLNSLPNDFTITDTIINNFLKYLNQNKFHSSDDIFYDLIALRERAVEEKLNKRLINNINASIKEFSKYSNYLFNKNLDFIKKSLHYEILKRFSSEYDLMNNLIGDDKVIQRAWEILKSDDYNMILNINH